MLKRKPQYMETSSKEARTSDQTTRISLSKDVYILTSSCQLCEMPSKDHKVAGNAPSSPCKLFKLSSAESGFTLSNRKISTLEYALHTSVSAFKN